MAKFDITTTGDGMNDSSSGLARVGARRRSKALLSWLVAAGALIALFGTRAWHASRPVLVWFESPPLGPHHHRIRCLAPSGWQIETDKSAAPYELVFIRPRQPLRCLPLPVRRWFARFRRDDGEVAIVWDETHWTSAAMNLEYRAEFHVQDRFGVTANGARWQLYYVSPDSRFFEATRSTICNSLRIE